MGCPQVFWLTGPPASGKSSLAQAACLLRSDFVILDADDLRKNLWPELGLSEEDRRKNILRIAWLARKINYFRHNVIVACIAPYRDIRLDAKKLIGETIFKEIFVKASLEQRIQRDPKGLYARAIKGEIKDLTGYDGVYEEPLTPDLVIRTDDLCLIDGAHMLVEFIKKCSS